MTLFHSILVICAAVVFLVIVIRCIITNLLLIKYALLWLAIGLFMLLSPLLYDFIDFLHERFSFPTASSMLAACALFFLFLLLLQLTVSISRASRERMIAAREMALLAHRLEILEKSSTAGDAKND
ncbi:MAG: DUF2304 domain-containing protein [Desulfovibrio sp.]|nr:DUF2304 domain-containing protein [Desulfovibrio sp.]